MQQVQTTSAGELRNIGSRLELFVDDWLIEQMNGVDLRMHHPAPQEVALEFNKAWEGPSSYDPVVIKEDDLFRLWYRGCGSVWADQRTGYAESADGIRWYRPELGVLEFEGSKENNTIILGSTAIAVCVFKDGNPAASNTERYKAIGVSDQMGHLRTLRGLVSQDGLHWKVLDRDPILVAPDDPWPMFDSHNVAFWDSQQNQYVIYARGWIEPGIRSIRRTTSPDFRNWSEFEFIDMGDAPIEHLYKNACTQYFRAPHIYLMFPKRFVPERQLQPDWPDNGISDAVFMTSRDGIHWDRRFMEAFLRPGPDPENWTDRNMYIGVGVVPTGQAEMSLYYMEHYKHPSVRLRRATLRTDGFVSINAPYGGGEFTTKPLAFEGTELVINYATSAVGSVRVEVQDNHGRPLDGHQLSQSDEIYGDEVEHVVAWQNNTSIQTPAGQPIRLRFVMKDADLYSMQFR